MYKLLKATFITVWSVFVLFPIMWAITTSFKPEAAVVNGATFIPWLEFQPVLTGWKAILPGPESLTNLLTPTLNSFIVTAGSTAISLIFGSLAAYGLSRFTYGWKRYSNADIIFFFVSPLDKQHLEHLHAQATRRAGARRRSSHLHRRR